MSRKSAALCVVLTFAFLCCSALLPAAFGQHSTEGTVAVTVLDPSGSIVPGADVELVDLGTGTARKAQTQEAGTYAFVNLPIGTYRLSVSKSGFKSQVFNTVIVQATKTTAVNATLAVGTQSETVEVTATASPVIETTSSAIGTVIDLKQIEDLPIQGRNLTQMTQLVPGYTGTLNDGGGTWNGLPSIAQGNSIDGVTGSAGRMKFGGAAEPAVEPRVENIQEMTVQTDQLDLNQGYGTSTMQINFVTRRGGNSLHGRVYEDFQNAALNAANWRDDFLNAQTPGSVPPPHLILNEFGGSLGGPIIKNKLFFFGSMSFHKEPSASTALATVVGPAAQTGVFSYTDNTNTLQTVNLFTLAANCTTCGSTPLPTTVSSVTQQELNSINSALKLGGVSANANPNFQDLTWHAPTPDNRYFPTVRVDYNASDRMRFNVAWNYTHTDQPASIIQALPGSGFTNSGAGNKFKNYTAAFGFDWTLSPTLINEFRAGFLYTANFFGYNATSPKPGTVAIGWDSIVTANGNNGTGTSFVTPVGSYYPVFNSSDTMTWQHQAHTVNFGFSWWREQNHYYNGVLGFPTVNLGLNSQDPAVNAFSTSTLPNSTGTSAVADAQALYASLVGRISFAGGSYAYEKQLNSYCNNGQDPKCITAYNLDELQKSFGMFVQDSYRIKPTLTINYGLRWDFTWPDQDLTGAYHSADNTAVWGPSGIGNIFQPGVLKGTNNPTLTQNSAPASPWLVTPQPAIGIAWNPHGGNGTFGKLLGGNNTVFRAGFSLRRFTEPQQYFWNQASDYGSFYFQNFQIAPQSVGGGAQPVGTFAPGSLSLDNNLSAVAGLGCSSTPLQYSCNPAQYHVTESVSDFTFAGGPGVNGVDRNIKQPYTESWNIGIQRQLGESRALEIRYIGNRSLRQWITINPNEVNIFENKFLGEFQNAQANLALNGGTSFADSTNGGAAGTTPLPIMDAAFSGDTTQFSSGGFIGDLQTGQAGAFANTLANTPLYYCDLVGSAAFAPCATNAGINVAGAGYPINFFQVNPYAIGTGFTFSQLVSKGYSNYNGLQVDLRQRAWHGLQFDANYTWSHTLGISTQNNWQGAVSAFTLRNMRLSYGPALFDIRHSVHISGTYDLPFGKGKTFATNGALDRVVGGWTIGTILTLQTGNPFPIAGGNNTYNDYADGGVILNGVTVSQLQSSVGVYHIPGKPTVDFINPKYLANNGTGGGANLSMLTPNQTPGTIARPIWLYGPRYVNDDLSLTKRIPITERVSFSLQAEALNAFNHPSFQVGSGSGCSYFCYRTSTFVGSSRFAIGGLSPSYQPRVLELRGNIEF